MPGKKIEKGNLAKKKKKRESFRYGIRETWLLSTYLLHDHEQII